MKAKYKYLFLFVIFFCCVFFVSCTSYEIPIHFNSNYHHIVTNNRYQLMRSFVHGYIEDHIDELINCLPVERVNFLQDNLILINRFELYPGELNYVSKYIVSLNDSLINDITVDYKKKNPFGFYRFK